MMDYTLGDSFDVKFTTRQFSSGAPFTLAGTPAVAAYPDNSTTQITAGITLSVDFDSVTGLHNIRVVASSGNGYASGSTYHLVLTAGTVDSVSVVGEVVGAFSLGRSAAAVDLANGTDGLGALKTLIDTIDNFLDTEIAAILEDTGTTLDGKLDTIDANVDAILADTGTDGVVVAAASKTGYRLSSTGVDDVLDEVIEGTTTLRESARGWNAVLMGKASGLDTTEATYRNLADDADRIVATVDADGNRTAVTRTLT